MIEYNNDFLNRLRDLNDTSPEVDIQRGKIIWNMRSVIGKDYKHYAFIDKLNILMASTGSRVFNECRDNFALNNNYYVPGSMKVNTKKIIEDSIGCLVYFIELCFDNDPEYYVSRINTKETKRDILVMLLNHINEKDAKYIPKEFCDILITHEDMISIVTNKKHMLMCSRENFIRFIELIYGKDEIEDLMLLLELEKIDT